MRSRIQLLNDLIKLNGDLKIIQQELSQYSWDVEEPLVTIDRANFFEIAQNYLNDKLSAQELENWANAIECRDDVNFEAEIIREFIFELANPVTNGAVNKQQVSKMIDMSSSV